MRDEAKVQETVLPARIMIVDDEAILMEALCKTLGDVGYQTFGFTKGSEALAAIHEQRFDVLLADLTMPEMDGIALLRAAFHLDPTLMGIIMTGEGTVTSAVEAMKSGAIDYILKPFKVSMILPVLSRAIAVRRLRLENVELARRVDEHTAELERTNRKLELANKELEAFAYSVSHDLRAPLRAAKGFSAILTEDHSKEISPEAARLLGRVTSSVTKMDQLIDDLLRFARVSRHPLSVKPVSLSTLTDQVLRELNTENQTREINIRVGELRDAMGDPSLIKQVLVNLLSNAYKFTRRRERATIEIGCTPDTYENTYFVRDNGAGFDMQYAERLFGVFQRMHSHDAFEGTGIGLSIVQRIVQRHGGRVWAEAEVEKGATFYFTLPVDAFQ